jgi:hypothetical protein
VTLDNHLYDTRELLGIMEAQATVPSYWLDLCFNREMQFTSEEIEFEKIQRNRLIAPLVIPTAQGRPIYSKASKVTRFRPAYVKPKDAVNESEIVARQPGSLLGTPPSKDQSYKTRVADIQNVHRQAVERRWEWLAAKAILDGAVTLEDNDYPTVVIDFGRAGDNTVTLIGADLWDSGTGDILGDINDWRTQVTQAKFGGPVNRLTVGTEAWEAMSNDPAVMELLDLTVRGTDATLNRGVREGQTIEFVGRINTLDVYLYSDYYELADGTKVDFMSPKDVVLTGPNVMGVRCFGAILDHKASFQALKIFPKMWDENDPPVTFIMNQSAPLMVPVNPDATLKARVVS